MLNTDVSSTSNRHYTGTLPPQFDTVNDSKIVTTDAIGIALAENLPISPKQGVRAISLLIPTPFPEELDYGYVGRLMCVNDVTTAKELWAKLAIWAGVSDKSRSEVSCLELLSLASNMELSLFVSQHTSLPFRRAIIADPPDKPHGCTENTSLLWASGMRLLREDAYFCHKCVEEDLDFHGQSFWRRSHQIPGVNCCQQHDVPLHLVADAKSAFLLPPSVYVQACQVVDVSQADITDSNSHIEKYIEICHGLIGRSSPMSAEHVAGILKNQAGILGFQTKGIGDKLLSDAVIEAFGRDWLRSVLPELAAKQLGAPLHNMDRVIFQKNSVTSVYVYILACAILFDSADDALNAMQSVNVRIKKQRQKIHINSN